MTYQDAAAGFLCPLPPYFEPLFPAFRDQYRRDALFLSDERLAVLQRETEVPDGCMDQIRAVQEAVCGNDLKHMAASFYLFVTVESRKPWENYLYAEHIFSVDGFAPESCNLLFVAYALAKTLIEKRPPKELNQTNLDAFRGYSASCMKDLGFWGIKEFHWNMLCAGGCMFMQGALKFCPGAFTGDFPVFTNGTEYLSTVAGEYGITRYGELASDQEEAVAHTVFEETGDYVRCNRIAKDGTVSFEPEVFSKAVWKDYLREGTPTLDIHIPPRMDYRPDVLMDAYRKAVPFYRTFYPDHIVRAVSGYSWIFSPQLRLILKPDSHILAVMDSMHILPSTETYSSDIRFVREGSSLQARIAEKESEGRRFHFGIMYVPVTEIFPE